MKLEKIPAGLGFDPSKIVSNYEIFSRKSESVLANR